MMKLPFIDLKSQYDAIKPEMDEAIAKVLNHTQFILGPEIEQFEKQLADFTGAGYAITCGSGTNALTLAMLAADLQPGDEVITTPFSFFATADTMVQLGIKPIFVDIDAHTFNINESLIEERITPKTRAIVPVSLYGLTPDMDKIHSIAQRHNLIVMEDAAQSFGATYKGKRSCNLSELSGTSFFPAKPLGAYGDGGAVFCQNEETAVKLKQLRVHGQTKRYYHEFFGINSRLDTLQAAILMVKLKRYPQEIERRQKIAARYTELLSACGEQLILPRTFADRESVWAQYTVRHADRDGLQRLLTEKGIPTSIHYPIPMSHQPAMVKKFGEPKNLEVSWKIANQVLSLPMFPDMTSKQQDMVVESVVESVKILKEKSALNGQHLEAH